MADDAIIMLDPVNLNVIKDGLVNGTTKLSLAVTVPFFNVDDLGSLFPK